MLHAPSPRARCASRSCSPTAGRARSSSSSTSSNRCAIHAAHGGDPADAIHVVCPTLPGYGFSDKPTPPGWGVERIADAWARADDGPRLRPLRRAGRRLGLGGDDVPRRRSIPSGCSASTSTWSRPVRARTRASSRRPNRRRWPRWREHREWDSATRRSSRPARRRSATGSSTRRPRRRRGSSRSSGRGADHDGHPEDAFTRHRLLDNVMHYWLPAAGASSARLYWESFARPARRSPCRTGGRVDLPQGDLRARRGGGPSGASPTSATGTSSPKGGHFAAFEQPAIFVDEVRAAFRTMR